ncbi:MAG: hypothetical protein U5K76_04495 [Woeseiaceae bacterium]|nr:hypothetical protein [Woeseiaceae bacterium]
MKYLLSFRERDRGGAVVPGRLVAGHELGRPESLRLETRVTLLIHGFNVNFDEDGRACSRWPTACRRSPVMRSSRSCGRAITGAGH